MSDGRWEAYEKLVLHELQENKKYLMTLDRRTQELSHSVAVLQVKAGVWGLLGGIVSAVSMVLIAFAK